MSTGNPSWGESYSLCTEDTIGTPNRGGAFALPLTEMGGNPIDPGQTDLQTKKASGKPWLEQKTNGDFRKGNRIARVTLPLLANADWLAIFLSSMLQNFTETSQVQTITPYTTTALSCLDLAGTGAGNAGGGRVALSLFKQHTTLGTLGEIMSGAIPESITISSSEDGNVELSVTLAAMVYDDTDDFTAGTAVTFADIGRNALIFSDMTTEINASSFDLTSWSITLNNNPRWNFFSNQTPQQVVLGPVTGTMEFTTPWISNTYKTSLITEAGGYELDVFNGSKTGATAGDAFLHATIITNQPPVESDDGGMKVITVSGDIVNNGSSDAFKYVGKTSADRITL